MSPIMPAPAQNQAPQTQNQGLSEDIFGIQSRDFDSYKLFSNLTEVQPKGTPFPPRPVPRPYVNLNIDSCKNQHPTDFANAPVYPLAILVIAVAFRVLRHSFLR